MLLVHDTCITDLSTLHEHLKNSTVSPDLIRLVLWKLYNDTKPETNILSRLDLDRVVQVFGDTVDSLVSSLITRQTTEEVTQDLDLLTGIAENLLFPLLYDVKWKSIDSNKGVAFIVKKLEKAIVHVTDSIDLQPNEPSRKVYSTRKNLYCEGEKRHLSSKQNSYTF